MLYITTAPLSLLTYYICELYHSELENVSFIEKADLIQFRNALVQGDSLQSKFYGVSLQNEKPPTNIVQSKENITYLSISKQSALKEWRKLIEEKEWIQELKLRPERYKSIINQTQIFTEDAEDWFWKRFKNYPAKMKREILNLEARDFNEKIPIQLLQSFYLANSVDLFLKLRNYLATPTATQVIKDIDISDLWTFFIGNKTTPAYIETAFLNKGKEDKENKNESSLLEPPLILLQQAVKYKNISIKAGAVVFNQWLIEIKTKKTKAALKLEYSIEDLKRLEQYLGI